MAINKRTYPNSYFAWYNDDNRVAIVCEDTTATSGDIETVAAAATGFIILELRKDANFTA